MLIKLMCVPRRALKQCSFITWHIDMAWCKNGSNSSSLAMELVQSYIIRLQSYKWDPRTITMPYTKTRLISPFNLLFSPMFFSVRIEWAIQANSLRQRHMRLQTRSLLVQIITGGLFDLNQCWRIVTGPLEKNSNEILIEIQTFSFSILKCHLQYAWWSFVSTSMTTGGFTMLKLSGMTERVIAIFHHEMHMYASVNYAIIGSNNGLPPIRRAIIEPMLVYCW